ncbi:MAG: hypothetical protein AB7F96_03390 [Beijerinckiaceae bacterium]
MSTASNYKIDFEEIKRSVSMEQTMRFLNLTGLKQRSATQWKGTCPFCGTIDSLVVSGNGGREKTGAFNCFRCPAGGDQIELVSLVRGNPRKDRAGVLAAARELHSAFLLPALVHGGGEHNLDASPQPRTGTRQAFDPEAYLKSLNPGHEALQPLGIDPETCRAWRSGFASTGIHRGRLAIAVADSEGAICGFVGRSLSDDGAVLTVPNGFDPRAHILGADRISDKPLNLARDVLDVLRACEAGFNETVCFLTGEIAPVQLEHLAALMNLRNCPSLTFF